MAHGHGRRVTFVPPPAEEDPLDERSALLIPSSVRRPPSANAPSSCTKAAACGCLGLALGWLWVSRLQSPPPPLAASTPPPSAASSPPPLLGAPPIISLLPFKSILNESMPWVQETAPLFECDDDDITKTYWYRWRLFNLHMVRRPAKAPGCGKKEGCWVITEFLQKVFWSGPYNTIVCPAGHHIMEGRWLRDAAIVDDYARFWFKGDGYRKQYTWWAAYALWQRSLLHHSQSSAGVQAELFGHLDAHYDEWVATHYSPKGRCMFTSCHADGEENSAGLDGCRPTINSVMFGEAIALRSIAAALGNTSRAAYYEREARKWQAVLTDQLWSDELGFFVNKAEAAPATLHQEWHKYGKIGRSREVQTYLGCLACHRPRKCPPERGWPLGKRVPVRELMGLSSPWYFSAVPSDDAITSARYARAFEQLEDPEGFDAKWGPRTTERRSPCYNFSNSAQCNWNGGSWPYETSKLGTALINLLQTYPRQPSASGASFDKLLRRYARAHTRSHAEQLAPPHVDEDLHPDDGYWITRRKLHGIEPWPKTGGLGARNGRDHLRARGTHYFHSTFNDLVLSGLVGVRTHAKFLELHPLTRVRSFCATRLWLRGVDVSVVWDADGLTYHHGRGLHVWIDGRPVGSALPHEQHDGHVLAPVVRVAYDGSWMADCSLQGAASKSPRC